MGGRPGSGRAVFHSGVPASAFEPENALELEYVRFEFAGFVSFFRAGRIGGFAIYPGSERFQ